MIYRQGASSSLGLKCAKGLWRGSSNPPPPPQIFIGEVQAFHVDELTCEFLFFLRMYQTLNCSLFHKLFVCDHRKVAGLLKNKVGDISNDVRY